jgi:hypothetical protein
VRDHHGQKLAYVYCEDEPGRRAAAKLLTRDEARRIAANIAKLPRIETAMIAAIMSVIFSRQLLFVIYFFVMLVICADVFFSGSLTAAGAALLASALSCFGTASFVGSWLARRERNYGPIDLVIIGAIAALLSAAGIALMAWSGFHFKLFDLTIGGPSWAIIGIVVGLLATKKEYAL